MWRALIPAALTLLFAANLWMQGTTETRRHILIVIAVLGTLVATGEWAARHPESWWARLLLKSRGPRTDGSITTREAGPAAGWTFLKFGLMALVLLAAVLFALDSLRATWVQTVLILVLPFVLFPAAMGILGGLYLLVRARLLRDLPRQ